jgi:hypothetical protein
MRTNNSTLPRGSRSSSNISDDERANPRDSGAGSVTEPAAGDENALPSREHNRMRTNARAVLYAGTTFQSTVIRDISFGGVGLSGARGLFPGERVTITLLNGASRTGVVRWWLGGCCGVKFDEPLTSEDAFFETAVRRAGAARA